MATWADPTATWADSTISWTGAAVTPPAPEEPRRTDFVIGWYFDQQDDWCDVVKFAEGRGEPFYV